LLRPRLRLGFLLFKVLYRLLFGFLSQPIFFIFFNERVRFFGLLIPLVTAGTLAEDVALAATSTSILVCRGTTI
jgi:hypothetical protein